MTHSEVRALLGDYLEGDLDVPERSRLDAHLPDCPDCSEELRALRETVFLLRGLPDVEPPADLGGAVMSRIAAGEATAPILLRAFRSLAEPRFAAPLAAGLMGLALFTGLQAITPERVTAPVGPLAGPSELPNSAGFEADYLTPDFIEKRLDAIARMPGASRDQQIHEFVEQLRRNRGDDQARQLLVRSRHALAPVVMMRFRVARPQPQPAEVPVRMTSGELR